MPTVSENESESAARKAADELIHHIGVAKAQFDEVNERIEQRAGRNLLLAIATGLAIGVVLVASLIFFKWAFLGVCVLAAAGAAVELSTALRATGVFVPRVGVAIGSVAIMAGATFFDIVGLVAGTAIGIGVVMIWYAGERLLRSSQRNNSGATSWAHGSVLRDLLAIVGVLVYTGSLIAFAALLLLHDRGEWWILGFIVVVVANDTGAYATGVLWGRHPMVPVISPKKSWEGFAGGAVIACITGVLVSWLMLPNTPLFGILFGASLVISGTLGDLLESFIKRRMGVKDMSSWLPGHGGILDRLDSLILSAPVAYLLFVLAAG